MDGTPLKQQQQQKQGENIQSIENGSLNFTLEEIKRLSKLGLDYNKKNKQKVTTNDLSQKFKKSADWPPIVKKVVTHLFPKSIKQQQTTVSFPSKICKSVRGNDPRIFHVWIHPDPQGNEPKYYVYRGSVFRSTLLPDISTRGWQLPSLLDTFSTDLDFLTFLGTYTFDKPSFPTYKPNSFKDSFRHFLDPEGEEAKFRQAYLKKNVRKNEKK